MVWSAVFISLILIVHDRFFFRITEAGFPLAESELRHGRRQLESDEQTPRIYLHQVNLGLSLGLLPAGDNEQKMLYEESFVDVSATKLDIPQDAVARPQMDICEDLAHKGQELYVIGDYPNAVMHLESALVYGTDNLRMLSAMYCLLGNAYFWMKDFAKALEYHRHDLVLAR
ncbi:unnamed protein product [Soboliphyme baturini]|uniref:TPR_REGION domain-containing protein n=1 Tax=Soboliphyme baturini TaxID=241478 RepID=A0A183J1E8_9BILA|nr:unnamed protein product [Soboliphyme baturini]